MITLSLGKMMMNYLLRLPKEVLPKLVTWARLRSQIILEECIKLIRKGSKCSNLRERT